MAMDLTFQLSSKTPKSSLWRSENCELRPVYVADQVSALSLMCQVNWGQYQQVESQQLFHCKPQIQSRLSKGKFRSDKALMLELLLNPECLNTVPSFLLHALDPAEFQKHWRMLIEHEPQALMIQSDSWYLQTVIQKQGSEIFGYRTVWNYLEPAMLRSEVQISPQLFSKVNEFIRDSELVREILPDYDDVSFEDVLERSADFLQKSVVSLTDQDSNPVLQSRHIVGDIIDNFVRISVETMPAIADEEDSVPLLRTVMDFLTEEEIEFEYSVDVSALRFDYVGQHGEWICYARTQEEKHVFVFYSILRFQVPQAKITDVLYYICKANYGLVMGNLEMDMADGEIRCKTSIDVEGDTLSPELVRNMMYANVSLMDQYLPGLMAILEQGKPAEAAIALVEV